MNQVKKTREIATFASCDICHVKFLTGEQVENHILYHQSDEFYNHWLTLYKKQKKPEEIDLNPIEITEPSEFSKYRPTLENSIPIKEKVNKKQETKSEYAISVNDLPYPWNNTSSMVL